MVHVHNMLPLFGPRALAAGREAGAGVVLELHNVRLFCAIGVAARDGGPLLSLPPPVHAARAGAQLPRLAARGGGLRRVARPPPAGGDRGGGPFSRAQPLRRRPGSAALGLPADRVEVLPHYLPAEAFAQHSVADEGRYALVAARLSVEKGIDTAIEAASIGGVPLRVAGEGPPRRS